jgi:hypothetical protein
VLSSANNAVLLKTVFSRLRHFFLGLFLLAAICFVAKPLRAADAPSLDDAIRQLAERIAAIPNLKGPIQLEVHDDVAFDESEGQTWKATLRRQLDLRKLSITEEPEAPLLRVGATETPTQIVLAAELVFADHHDLRFVALKRALLPSETLLASPVRIEKQLLFDSPERILDAASATRGAADDLVVLTYRNSELTALRLDPAGSLKQAFTLSAAGFKPSRDPRAELTASETDGHLQFPGKLCEFAWAVPADVKCRATTKTSWRPLPSLASPCDYTTWKLQSDGSDWTAGDLLQVVPETVSHQGAAAPLLSDFPGPILSINSGQNPHSVLVVVRNLRTGNYEVFKLTLACGN